MHTTPGKCNCINENPEMHFTYFFQLLRSICPIQHARYFYENQEARQRNHLYVAVYEALIFFFHFSKQPKIKISPFTLNCRKSTTFIYKSFDKLKQTFTSLSLPLPSWLNKSKQSEKAHTSVSTTVCFLSGFLRNVEKRKKMKPYSQSWQNRMRSYFTHFYFF